MKITIFGDICPTEDYQALFDLKNSSKLFDGADRMVSGSDLVICNLECPVTESTKSAKKCGPSLRAKPEDLEVIRQLGVNIVSLANNHIKDYKAAAVEDTIINCTKQGFDVVGAGKNINEARKPLIQVVDGQRIGLISFAEEEFNAAYEDEAGANLFDPYTSFDDVRALRSLCDYVIALYHGGVEHYIYPSPLLQKKCRKIVECGADLVLCQHSHCIGTIEQYREGTILYGQGNTIFGYQKENRMWNEGLVVQIDITDQAASISYLLINATPNGIVLADDQSAEKRIENVYSASKKLHDKEFLQNSWYQFCRAKEPLYMPMYFGKSVLFNRINRLLGNRLISLFYGNKEQMISMNLMRCDSHHEIMQTLLEKNSKCT